MKHTYLDHCIQEEKKTPNLNHLLIYSSSRFVVSRMNNLAAKATKQTRKTIDSKPGDILKYLHLLIYDILL